MSQWTLINKWRPQLCLPIVSSDKLEIVITFAKLFFKGGADISVNRCWIKKYSKFFLTTKLNYFYFKSIFPPKNPTAIWTTSAGNNVTKNFQNLSNLITVDMINKL